MKRYHVPMCINSTMTKPPPASLPTSNKAHGSQAHPSPEKKKRRKPTQQNHHKRNHNAHESLCRVPNNQNQTLPLWQTLSNLHPSCGNPYNPSQLFAENGKSLHQDTMKACSLLAKLLKKDLSVFRKSVPTQSNWETLFSKATTSQGQDPLNY